MMSPLYFLLGLCVCVPLGLHVHVRVLCACVQPSLCAVTRTHSLRHIGFMDACLVALRCDFYGSCVCVCVLPLCALFCRCVMRCWHSCTHHG